jgi:predicted tellurium resistance membrane protein TerC
MNELFSIENVTAFLTLSFLEVVLGIDNLIFISILVEKVEKKKRELARKVGLILALGTRILLLLSFSAIMKLSEPLFTVASHTFSGKDLILLAGGLFLLAKSTHEIHQKVENPTNSGESLKKNTSFLKIVIQIALLDIVFSIDSVITAIGMAKDINIMIAAIVVAIITMLVFAKSVAEFIEEHPTIKMLALSFLMLIGVMLIGESFGQHLEKGYIYSAIGFSLFVEMLNMRFQKNTKS